MPGRDDGAAPEGAVAAIGLAVLIVVTAIALRGRVPGVEPTSAAPPAASPVDDGVAWTVVVGLLMASAAVTVLAVVARWRRRGGAPSSVAARPDWLRDGPTRLSWRVAVIVFVGAIGALIAVTLLRGLGGGYPTDPSALRQPDGAPSPAAGDRFVDPARSTPPSPGHNPFEYLVVPAVIILVVFIAGAIITTRARRRPVAAPLVEAAAAEVSVAPLARAAEVGLAEVGDPSRGPRQAIIACYAAMERELANVPDAVPQDFDTASEVLARAVEHHALGPGSATQLVELFDEARFSPHVMDEGHRDAAAQVLQRVLQELQSRA